MNAEAKIQNLLTEAWTALKLVGRRIYTGEGEQTQDAYDAVRCLFYIECLEQCLLIVKEDTSQ